MSGPPPDRGEPLTPDQATDLLLRLAADVGAGTASARTWWRGWLETVEAPQLAVLDHAARRSSWSSPLGAWREWAALDLAAVGGLGAVVAAMHPDGHLRERALRVLGTLPRGPLPSRAMALRLVDPVQQVRDVARALVLPPVDVAEAAVVLEVLVVVGERRSGPPALAALRDAVQERLGTPAVVTLSQNGSRAARRTATRWALEDGALGVADLERRAGGDDDQLVRTWCAEALLDADPGAAARLTTSSAAATRALAVVRGPDLVRAQVEPLLLDRSARVRRAAQWWVARDGGDPAAAYRDGASSVPLRVRLEGRRETGERIGAAEAAPFLAHPDARVRVAALHLLDDDATASSAVPALADPVPRVARVAATVLRRTPGSLRYADLAVAAADPRPWVRTAAWRVRCSLGVWDRLLADLEVRTDPDPLLSSLGEADRRAWTARHAAEAGQFPPSDPGTLLEAVRTSDLDEFTRRWLTALLGGRR